MFLQRNQGPVVQSVVSLTSSLRVISLTVLVDSIYNFLIFFAEKATHCKSYSHFFLTSSLRVISLTVLVDSIYNFLIFFAEKATHCKSYSHFFSKKFQHICVSLDVNFNESLTNDIVSFEQLGPVFLPL